MYKKSKARVISDAVCAVLFLASILAFILIGIFAHVWHPTWVMVPCVGILDGIITIVVNTCTSIQTKDANNQSEDK